MFASVAAATALAMVIATPAVIRYEFEQIEGPLSPAPTASAPAPAAPASVGPSQPGPSAAPTLRVPTDGPTGSRTFPPDGATAPVASRPGQAASPSPAAPSTPQPSPTPRASPTSAPLPHPTATRRPSPTPGPTAPRTPSPSPSGSGQGGPTGSPRPSSSPPGGPNPSPGPSGTPGHTPSPGPAGGGAAGAGSPASPSPAGAASQDFPGTPAAGARAGIVRAVVARPYTDPTAPGIDAADAHAPSARTVADGLAADEVSAAPPSPPISPSLPPDIRLRWVEFERATSTTLVLIAIGAVLAASLLGFLLANRLLQPLRRLEQAAAAVAGGDLSRRSGLGDRRDEVGELGRSFDTMAMALQASDEQRRRFLQDVVHELRTPLTVIDATSNAMLDGVYPMEPAHLETIREQAHLLARIVEDLRTLNLAEIGKLPLSSDAVDAATLLATTVDAFQARASAADRRIVQESEPGLLVLGDEDRLRQVLAALVDNALRHAPPGGEVRLRARRADTMVQFEVEDTGPGVAPGDLGRVFERFYEADPARDRAAGHSGLGLAIVKALVEAHGGRVGVENVPGSGARFWFQLPTAAEPVSALAGRPETA